MTLKRLNAYQFTPEFIIQGIEFIKSDRSIFPTNLKFPSEQREFARCYEGFHIKNNQLYLN